MNHKKPMIILDGLAVLSIVGTLIIFPLFIAAYPQTSLQSADGSFTSPAKLSVPFLASLPFSVFWLVFRYQKSLSDKHPVIRRKVFRTCFKYGVPLLVFVGMYVVRHLWG